jgi:hypothetical protein
MKINFSFGAFSHASFFWPVPLIKKTLKFTLDFYTTPDKFSVGITSRCVDGLHVLFFDYDYMDYASVKSEIKRLQKDFMLGPAYVFELDRPNSFHVIILDKFTLHDALSVLQCASIDFAFATAPIRLFYREWVLRIGRKGGRASPVYKALIPSEYGENEISTAHKLFLQKYYKVPLVDYPFEDGYTQIPAISYNTGNRVN